MATEKINVDKLIKELSKGDLREQAAVIQHLINVLSQRVEEKQQELEGLKNVFK